MRVLHGAAPSLHLAEAVGQLAVLRIQRHLLSDWGREIGAHDTSCAGVLAKSRSQTITAPTPANTAQASHGHQVSASETLTHQGFIQSQTVNGEAPGLSGATHKRRGNLEGLLVAISFKIVLLNSAFRRAPKPNIQTKTTGHVSLNSAILVSAVHPEASDAYE